MAAGVDTAKQAYDVVYVALGTALGRQLTLDEQERAWGALNRLLGLAQASDEELEATKVRLRPLAAEVRRYREVFAQLQATMARASED